MQVQVAERVSITMNTKKSTPRYIISKMPNYKDRENLESSKGEIDSSIQWSSGKASSLFLSRNTISQKGRARNIPSNEKQRPTTNTTLSSKALN